jgi:hypothetical protein
MRKSIILPLLIVAIRQGVFGQSKPLNHGTLIPGTLNNYTIYNEANYGDTNKTKFNAFTIDGGIRMIKDDRRFKVIIVYSKQGTYKIVSRFKTGKYGNSIFISQTINKIK